MGAGPWTQDTALLLAALGCTDRESWGGGGDHHPCSQPLPSRRGAQEVCKDVYMLDWPC